MDSVMDLEIHILVGAIPILIMVGAILTVMVGEVVIGMVMQTAITMVSGMVIMVAVIIRDTTVVTTVVIILTMEIGTDIQVFIIKEEIVPAGRICHAMAPQAMEV